MAVDPVLELQGAIISRLKATPAVTAIVGHRVADIPKPEWASLPYISIGASNYQTDNFDCIVGGDIMIQIDCWSVATVLSEVRLLAGAVRAALHGWEPTLTTNALVTFDHWRTDYVRSPPINQASIRYTAIIEEP